MRIAIFSDAYLPEGTLYHVKMLHELAVELVSRGHEVVIISPGEIKQPQSLCRFELDHVDVWKFRCRPLRGISHIQRAINETLLSWSAYRAISESKLDTRFDLVINYSPTIFFGPLMRWVRGKGAFVYLVLRDFFPQWAIDEGLIKSGSLVERYFRFFERLNYQASDVIGIQSPANIPVFEQIVWPRHFPTEVLFNWAAPLPLIDDSFGRSFIEGLGLKDKFIYFYGGNIGHAQDIPYILRLADSLRSYEGVHFLILGQGDQYKNISLQIHEMELTNTTLAPSVTQDEYRSLLTQVDVGVFTLASSHRSHNFPGKILGYLAQGLPVLGAVNSGNDLIEIVNEAGAGRVTINGEYERFVQDAVLIYEDAAARQLMQSNAKVLIARQFSVVAAADQILNRYAQER
jgi:glycosyltransferase involved in cell wall biosynthesis